MRGKRRSDKYPSEGNFCRSCSLICDFEIYHLMPASEKRGMVQNVWLSDLQDLWREVHVAWWFPNYKLQQASQDTSKLEGLDKMTEYIVKCIQCKKEFDQVNPYKRLCESCRMSNYKSQVAISQKKQSIKRKEQRKQQTKHLKKTCPVCQYEFKTARDSKKYCSKRCLTKKQTFVTQIINNEKHLRKSTLLIIVKDQCSHLVYLNIICII